MRRLGRCPHCGGEPERPYTECEKRRDYKKRFVKRKITSMNDSYIKELLYTSVEGIIPRSSFPQWLIDLKREELSLHRYWLETNKETGL